MPALQHHVTTTFDNKQHPEIKNTAEQKWDTNVSLEVRPKKERNHGLAVLRFVLNYEK